MVIDSANALRNLKKKGFTEAPGDHKFLEYYHNGKLVLHTKISHGGRHDLSEGLISKMSQQCKLNKIDFINLANCPLSADEYLKKLKKQRDLVDD